MGAAYPWFVKRDLDGFFGLFVDNLLQLLVIAGLCMGLCGFSAELVFGAILPGAAISVVVGNLYYAHLARKVARALGRSDITALPYGINTPSVFAYVFLVILPTYLANQSLGQETAARLAWQAGLMACLGSGIIETAGAFVGESLRRWTPRAALLAALAAISITFISMEFMLRIYANPIVAFLPLGILLTQFFSRIRIPAGLPAGMVAVIVGSALYWSLPDAMVNTAPGARALHGLWDNVGLRLPRLALADLIAGLDPALILLYLGVIVPMGVMNVVGSLQNIESAAAAGDPYPVRPCMLANGIGTIAAACCGSCFPTTIYIGHPGWKSLGSRVGYSVLNAAVIAVICFAGLVQPIARLVPIEAAAGILVWIAIIIGAQAFQATPPRHAPAIILGFFPAVAGYAKVLLGGALAAAAATAAQTGADELAAQLNLGQLVRNGSLEQAGIFVHGILALESGFVLTCMILAAVGVFLIERRFLTAAAWMAVSAALALVGILHGYTVTASAVVPAVGWAIGWPFSVGYLLLAALFTAAHFWRRHPEQSDDNGGDQGLS